MQTRTRTRVLCMLSSFHSNYLETLPDSIKIRTNKLELNMC